MNTDPTSTDVFAILAVAQANWPHDPVAGSEAVWRKWGEPLGRYPFEEVAAALDSLALATGGFRPSLSSLESSERGEVPRRLTSRASCSRPTAASAHGRPSRSARTTSSDPTVSPSPR